ncbi:putrescine transport system permease protein PotH [Arthrobacter sp. Hiyo4]|nr:putrescine transport system permease protein PotH [Arthrobacter sp. Hiyo4]
MSLKLKSVGSGVKGSSRGWLLFTPAFLFFVVFFLVPLGVMFQESMKSGGETYQMVLQSTLYGRIFADTARVAFLTTIACLLLAYPYAYVLNRVGPRLKLLLIVLVLMPFWVSLLSRTFAWVGLLQDTGIINSFLQFAGLISAPLPLIRTPVGVLIGMVHVLLPYMVLPLMNTMADIDKGQLQAARSLGATPLQRFLRVFLPLSGPGIIAGFVLVFVLSLGFYITPAMLGAPGNMMIGELLIQETQKVGLVRASALGILLLGGTLVSLGLLAGIWKTFSRKTKS